ncbi:MAG: hypothetical protein R3Y32_06455 [Bacillota bacterium]
MNNNKRQIVKIIEEISAEKGYACNVFADGFCIEISNGENTTRVFGYQFDNATSASMIATDKCACFELLNQKNIPAVPHFLILAPEKEKYVPCPIKAEDLIAKYKTLVAKPCKGTSGANIFKFSGIAEYSEVEKAIMPFSRDIALSPFLPLEREFRCLILNGTVQLIYEKIRCDSWKHNLASGAVPVVHQIETQREVALLGIETARTLGLDFCAVDIATCADKNSENVEKLLVIEVNSGIMFEKFAQFSLENYENAKNIYKKALAHFLKEE